MGLDIASEGPISKKKGSSYIVNYRYAVVGLARLIGYPTQPVYQDLSFNLNFPLAQKGNVKVFGIMKVFLILDVQKHMILLMNIHGVILKVYVKKEGKIIMNQKDGKNAN